MIAVGGGDIVVVAAAAAGMVVDELTYKLSAWISSNQTKETSGG